VPSKTFDAGGTWRRGFMRSTPSLFYMTLVL
jgi:hypothetical protein